MHHLGQRRFYVDNVDISALLWVFYRRHTICIALSPRLRIMASQHGSIRLNSSAMDRPHSASSGTLHARAPDASNCSARCIAAAEKSASPGKPVGAVVAAANVLRALHAAERPLNASEVARAAGSASRHGVQHPAHAAGRRVCRLRRGDPHLSVSLHILELAYGALRRSGLMDMARPLMHAVADAHGVSVYLSKVLGPSSLLLLDWVGAGCAPIRHVTVGRQHPGPAGASGVVMAAFGNSSRAGTRRRCSRRLNGTRSRPFPISWRGSKRRGKPALRSIAARCSAASRWCRCRFCRRPGNCC